MTGFISGDVIDVNNVGIGDATVVASSGGSPVESTTTDGNGNYTLEVPTGTYDVRAEKPGFRTNRVAGVVVNDNSTTSKDFVLSTLQYKVLGDRTGPDSVGVLGYDDVASGTPIGVKGAVPGADGYGLSTPDDARVEGEVSTTSGHVLTVDGNRSLFLGAPRNDAAGNSAGGNVVGGSPVNGVGDGAVGAAIGGGGTDDVFLGGNVVRDNYGTVSGGTGNRAGDLTTGSTTARYAAVGGGFSNVAAGEGSTIAGGYDNEALGNSSTVGGGYLNSATTGYATVAGGQENTADAKRTTVAGGQSNVVAFARGTVGGGTANLVNTTDGTIAGGNDNLIVDSGGTIGGGASNVAGASGAGLGTNATVAGGRNSEAIGQESTVAGGGDNLAKGTGSTVAGGTSNVAFSNYATVAGGKNHFVSGQGAIVAGGLENDARDEGAAVLGGKGSEAWGKYSMAFGNDAHADHDGAVVFADSSSTAISSSGPDEIRSQMPIYAPDHVNTSARAAKTGIESVDPGWVLSGVESLEVSTWRFKDDDTRHMGPMAGEFRETFDLGDDDGHISTVDADGVAFAAIQGLAERLETAREERDALRRENEQLRTRLRAVEDRLDDLSAERTADGDGRERN